VSPLPFAGQKKSRPAEAKAGFSALAVFIERPQSETNRRFD